MISVKDKKAEEADPKTVVIGAVICIFVLIIVVGFVYFGWGAKLTNLLRNLPDYSYNKNDSEIIINETDKNGDL